MGELNKGFVGGDLDTAAKHASLSALDIDQVKGRLVEIIVNDLNQDKNPLYSVVKDNRFNVGAINKAGRVDFSLNAYNNSLKNATLFEQLGQRSVRENGDVLEKIKSHAARTQLFSELVNQEIKNKINEIAFATVMDSNKLGLGITTDLVQHHIDEHVTAPLQALNDRQLTLAAALDSHINIMQELHLSRQQNPAFASITEAWLQGESLNTLTVMDTNLIGTELAKAGINEPKTFAQARESLVHIARASDSPILAIPVDTSIDIGQLGTINSDAGINMQSDTYQSRVSEQHISVLTSVQDKEFAKIQAANEQQPNLDVEKQKMESPSVSQIKLN